MKRRVRLTESDLHKIIKKSVNRVLNEKYDPYENGDEYEEITDRLYDAYQEYISAIRALQKFHFRMDDSTSDMYNSYAGKYGDEAIQLAQRSYNKASQLYFSDEEEM